MAKIPEIVQLWIDNTQNKKDIEDLQEENIVLKTELEETKQDLDKSAVHGHERGEFIHVEDSGDLGCKIGIEGNDKQEGEASLDNAVEIQTVKDSVTVTACNKNLAKINTTNWELTENNAIKNKAKNNGANLTIFTVKKRQTVKLNFKLLSRIVRDTSFSFYKNTEGTFVNDSTMGFSNIQSFTLGTVYTKTFTAEKDTQIRYTMWGNVDSEIFEFQFWVELDETTDYIEHTEQSITIPVQREMLQGDGFVKVDGIWKEVHTKEKFVMTEETGVKGISTTTAKTKRWGITTYKYKDSSTNKSNYFKNNNWIFGNDYPCFQVENSNSICFRLNKEEYPDLASVNAKLKALNEAGTPLYFQLMLKEPVILDCTEEQTKALEELQKFRTYKNVTNVQTDSIAIIDLDYKKDLETILNNMQAQILA